MSSPILRYLDQAQSFLVIHQRCFNRFGKTSKKKGSTVVEPFSIIISNHLQSDITFSQI
jgi:hypothetical protein